VPQATTSGSITNNVPALGSLPATVITESYTQLKEISNDVDDARVYGGIHFRYDQDAGDVLGRVIATEVVKNNLRPVHPQESASVAFKGWTVFGGVQCSEDCRRGPNPARPFIVLRASTSAERAFGTDRFCRA
jgi:hypothetical protein